ncbi:hypothetical protein HDV05_008797 [Chytridiales sp. JEL 0842]|nr:hypothetical protein HDV05_008797 [Chytridiales sp. JEL 0842]
MEPVQERYVITDAVRPYVSSYVWSVTTNEEKRNEVLKCLESGNPYIEEEEMAIVMIDISGYSALSADLSKLGKLSSELITTTVDAFFQKVIKVIALYGGDIVKFLGDALLVSFGKVTDTDTQQQIVERAITCCIHILQKHPTITIDLNNLPADARKSSNVESVMHQTSRRISVGGKSTYGHSNDSQTITLGMHLACTSGQVQRIIMGKPSVRLDYTLQATCFSHLSELLASTNTSAFTSEFRKVTIVFAKLPYSAHTSEMNQLLCEFVTQIDKYHGVFQQLSVDDKGRKRMTKTPFML